MSVRDVHKSFVLFRRNSPPVGQGSLIHELSRSHSNTPHSAGVFLDEWSIRSRDVYLTTHNTHNTQHSTHNTQHNTHNTQHTTLNTQHNTQHSTHNTQHNTHKRQASIPTAGFEPTISAGEQPQTHPLDRAATATGVQKFAGIKMTANVLWQRFECKSITHGLIFKPSDINAFYPILNKMYLLLFEQSSVV